jgi:hypothetical protein
VSTNTMASNRIFLIVHLPRPRRSGR